MAKLSPDARAWLDAARGADDPTPEQRASADAAARIALAMHGMTDMPKLAPPAPAPAPGGMAKVGSTAGWKLGTAAVALLAGGLIALHAARPAAEPARTAQAVLPAAAPAPAVTVTAPAAVPADQALRMEEAKREDAAERRVAGSAVGGTVHSQARGAARVVRARAHLPAKPASDADLQAEVALIASANAALRAQRYAEAQRVLDDHARRFPRGALREERSALDVLALCSQEPGPRALAAMHAFLRTAPQSVVAQRVRAACEAPGGAP